MANFRYFVEKMQNAQKLLPEMAAEACKGAILRSHEAAVEATPTNKVSGVNTDTGALRNHWQTEGPTIAGSVVTTALTNDVEYASYVNDGHRMDRHFVPGLYVDASGTLSYDPAADVGIMVGTQTEYVPGVFMTDKAKKAYQKTLSKELHAKVKELMQ